MTKNTSNKRVATHQGELVIGDKKLSCAVLNDHTRVITMSAVFKAFGRTTRSKINVGNRVINMPSFLDAQNLQRFVSTELNEVIKPIFFTTLSGKEMTGYDATIIPLVCDVYLAARTEDALTKKQKHLAVSAEMIVRSLSKLGITALVDEATGYQNVRENDALQKLLDKYLNDYARKWAKTFPEPFWEKLLKIKGYSSYIGLPRPSFVGHWVNDVVYNRLAPGITKKLKEINPRTEKGYRKSKHHQHLTEEHGLPELKDHISKVMVLMDAAANKTEFDRLLNRSLPAYDKNNLELFLDNK